MNSAIAIATERCKVCGGASRPFGRARLLGRYDVQYYQCSDCRFVQTEKPYWLEEAYATALTAGDVGAVERNLELAEITQAVIQRFFRADGQFLDYGGGHGLFVRLMRDRGFDFWWRDKYAQNLFSVGFAAEEGNRSFELVTAFEVLEHLEDPVTDLGDMLSCTHEALLVSTQLLPSSNPKPGDWWYYATGGGQHIALYTPEALQRLARLCGYNVISDGAFVHLFSRKRISEAVFRAVIRKRVRRVLNWLSRRNSLIGADFNSITGDVLR